jgi:hypothetical protein
MLNRMMVTRVLPALVAGMLTTFAVNCHQARAQAALPSPNSMGPVVKGNDNLSVAQPSQAGLPGSRRAMPVNKGAISSTLLSPNDALFDSIDRGDIVAARDAVARGADLSATNAVGQSPIDESVDLGRNDITFLLVTLLHAGGAEITDAQGGPMASPPANTLGLSSKDQHTAAAPVAFFGSPAGTPSSTRRKNKSGTSEASATTPLRNKPPRQVSQPAYADSSGAPVPSAGFVGFGASGQ